MIDPFNVTNMSSTIPVLGVLLNQVNFLINIFVAFGGMVLIFIVFTIWKVFTMRRELRMLKEIRVDVKKVKRKLKVR